MFCTFWIAPVTFPVIDLTFDMTPRLQTERLPQYATGNTEYFTFGLAKMRMHTTFKAEN